MSSFWDSESALVSTHLVRARAVREPLESRYVAVRSESDLVRTHMY